MTPEHMNPTAQQRARIAQERARRPNMLAFAEAVDAMNAARTARDINMMPSSYYDHVHDRVYVQLLDENGYPSSMYKAEDAIDPDINNREYRTVED